MKAITGGLASLLLVATLAACGSSQGDEENCRPRGGPGGSHFGGSMQSGFGTGRGIGMMPGTNSGGGTTSMDDDTTMNSGMGTGMAGGGMGMGGAGMGNGMGMGGPGGMFGGPGMGGGRPPERCAQSKPPAGTKGKLPPGSPVILPTSSIHLPSALERSDDEADAIPSGCGVLPRTLCRLRLSSASG